METTQDEVKRELAVGGVDILAVSRRNGRDRNEDSFALLRLEPVVGIPVLVVAVADGMGGHLHGEEVSREALRRMAVGLCDALVSACGIYPGAHDVLGVEVVKTALAEAVLQAALHVQRMVIVNEWGTAGTTIVVAAIVREKAIVSNLGDSPCYHYSGGERKLAKLTQDHSLAGILLSEGLITPEMARFHEGRDRLEFFLGSEQLPKEIPLEETDLVAGDILMLCSDGAVGSLSHEDVEQVFALSAGNLESVARELLARSVETGEHDNQTVVLLRFGADRDAPDGEQSTASDE